MAGLTLTPKPEHAINVAQAWTGLMLDLDSFCTSFLGLDPAETLLMAAISSGQNPHKTATRIPP